jgi:acid phosphatase family membrane protein YuiD
MYNKIMIDFILQYKLFLIPFIVIVCAQLMKFTRLWLKHGFQWDDLFDPGHFPSAHSAFVTSLVITIGYYNEMSSAVFAIAACFAFITIYDAIRVRMHIGLQGKTLNQLVEAIPSIDQTKFPRLKEHVGHYANEVIGGIGVGIIITVLLICIITLLQ